MVQPQYLPSYRGFSSSAVSHFFSVPELVGEVVSHLGHCNECDGPPCTKCKKTLASVALVSGAFAEFAFRRLWANLESWSPLLNILPSSFRKKVDFQGIGSERTEIHTYDLCAPIVQDEWDRFTYYAHFVRKFQISKHEKISTPDIMTLVSCSDGNPFLPRLEHVGVKSQDDFPLYFFQMLHEYTHSCDLFFPPHPYGLHPPTVVRSPVAFDHYLTLILTRVNERAPNLQKFTLDVHTHGANDSLRKLALFNSVHTMELSGEISCARLVEACGQLPKLACLSLCFPDPLRDVRDEWVSIPGDVSGFHRLENLTVKAPSLYALNLLRTIKSEHMHSVSIFSGADNPIWMEITKTLAARFKRLRDVALCIACRVIAWYDFSDGPPSFADLFGALNGLHELQYVRLSTIGLELAIQDADLRGMARAWPLLDTLMIEAAWDFMPHSAVLHAAEPMDVDELEVGEGEIAEVPPPPPKREHAVLTSLQAFVDNCPALRFLELPLLDWKTIDDFGKQRAISTPHATGRDASPMLERLRFTGARFPKGDGREECERYLYSLFPGVNEIEYGVVTEEVETTDGQSFTWVSWDRLLTWC